MAGFQDIAGAWVITNEDKIKHDNQFYTLNPIGGFLTGEQAKVFFMQSGLPMPILGKIWQLADMNADGKMDHKEFSIAMFIIKKALQGFEIPPVLPPSLLDSIVQGGLIGSGLQMKGVMSSSYMSSTLPHHHHINVMQYPILHNGTIDSRSKQPISSPLSSTSVEWVITPSQKLRYKQSFNNIDTSHKGYLTGLEAKEFLSQSGLTHSVLAQIWSLADYDTDGNLSIDEYCIAMYLIEQSKSGQLLPSILPQDLIPPSVRRLRRASESLSLLNHSVTNGCKTDGSVMVGDYTVNLQTSKSQATLLQTHQHGSGNVNTGTLNSFNAGRTSFGGIASLGGSMGVAGGAEGESLPLTTGDNQDTDSNKIVTFEDKRKENFDKGQAELEKRRLMLRNLQQQESQERLAAERAEQEKREKLRLEQELKKQQELEKYFERQRQVEAEREEQRLKLLEQRDAARREMERQRQLEWERQRRDQLNMERSKERNLVDSLKQQNGQLKLEISSLDSKKEESNSRLEKAKNSLKEFESSIDEIQLLNSMKLNESDNLKLELEELDMKVVAVEQEYLRLSKQDQGPNSANDVVYNDTVKSHSTCKKQLESWKEKFTTLDTTLQDKQNQVTSLERKLEDLKNQIIPLQIRNSKTSVKMLSPFIAVKTSTSPSSSSFTQGQARDQISSTGFLEDKLFSNNKSQDLFKEGHWFPSSPNISNQTVKSLDACSCLANDFTETKSTNIENVWVDDFNSVKKIDLFNPKEPLHFTTNIKENQTKTSVDVWANFDAIDPTEPTNINWMADFSNKFAPDEPADGKKINSDMKNIFENEFIPNNSTLNNQITFGSQFDDSSGHFNSINQDNFNSSKHVIASNHINLGINNFNVPSSYSLKKDEVRHLYKALFQFDARSTDELSVKVGDVVSVNESDQMMAEPDWLIGRIDDKIGCVPENYLSKIEDDTKKELNSFGLISSITTNDVYDMVTSGNPKKLLIDANTFLIDTPVDTNLNASDNKLNDSNFNQKITLNGFPVTQSLNFQLKLDEAPKELCKVQALSSWYGKKEEHLSFKKGDIINLIDQQDSAWWTGRFNDKVGSFPKTYVKLIGNPYINSTAFKKPPINPGLESFNSKETTLPDNPLNIGNNMVPPKDLPQRILSASSDKSDAEIKDILSNEFMVFVLYKFDALVEGDLSLEEGDVFLAQATSDEWWTGTLNGVTGIFPSCYVERMETMNISKLQGTIKPEIARVIADYISTSSEQLNLQAGQFIQVRKKSESGWWEGELQLKGQKRQIGWFPGNYVQVLGQKNTDPDSLITATTSVPFHEQSIPEETSKTTTSIQQNQYKGEFIALYTFNGETENDLTIHKGDVIHLIDDSNLEWWKGELNGNVGLFPSNYVTPWTKTNS